VTDRVRIAAKGGVNATAKVLALVAGMVAGADSISDMDLLRHSGMGRLFTDIRAPSTLGTFLRLSFGHVRQLDAVAAGFPGKVGRGEPVLSGPGRLPSSTSRTRCGRRLPRARGATGANPGNQCLQSPFDGPRLN
jgi:hypothetical protein